MRTLMFGLACGLVVAACNSSTPKVDDPAVCVQGWWVDPTAVACGACSGTSPNPECAFDDCEQLSFEGFVSEKAVFDGILTHSKKSGTISSVGPGVWRQYSISGLQIRLSGSQGGSLTCSGTKLNGSYSFQVRAPSSIATALAAGAANKAVSFRGIPTGS